MDNIYQWVIGILIAAIGFFVKGMKENIDVLDKRILAISDKSSKDISDICIKVAMEFVHKSEFEKMGEAIFKKLDRIEDKLDGKEDKK